MNTAGQVEQILRAHRLSGLEELPEHLVLPHYDGYSIANVPSTIAAMLGVDMPAAAPPLPRHLWADMADGVRRVVLVIVDALGYRQFQSLLDGADTVFDRLVGHGRLFPITSIFPSTTVVALTTFRTGQPPLEHGFLGTRMLLPEQGVVADMLALAPAMYRQQESLLKWGWEAETFVTSPGLAECLSAAGVRTVAHTRIHFVGRPLSTIFLHGMSKVRGDIGFGDLWINLRQTLTRLQDEHAFVNVYWNSLDDLAHLYGPADERCQVEMRYMAQAMEEGCLNRLPPAAREGTLLMLLADHGQIATPPERVVHLSDHPKLERLLLLPPAGESRAAYLYVRREQAGALRDYVAHHLADRFLLLEMERALQAGLFGPGEISPRLRSRLGDFLLLAQDDSRLVAGERKIPLHGHHGSLTPEEMWVPLLLARLDKLS